MVANRNRKSQVGWRWLVSRWLPHVGSKWNNGSNCGSRSVNGNNVAANRNANNGARPASDTREIKRLSLIPWLDLQAMALCQNTLRENGGASRKSSKVPPLKEVNHMKRYGNLWDEVISEDNLRQAYKNACRSSNKKSHATKNAIRRTKDHIDDCIKYLQYILSHKTWKPSKYKERVIYEPKKRTIYIAKFFPDRVLHHAFVDVAMRVWDKLMIYDTYSCRVGKGQHKGSRRCMEFIRRYKYCLKCDISKFYPSLDHDLIETIIRRKIKDKNLIWSLDLIVDSFKGRKNAPIGNLTSQWFGNLYLSGLDDFVKQTLHIKGYIRYCDDFILFGNSKTELREAGRRVRDFVENQLLLSFSKFDLFPVTRGIDFLGYRHFPNGCILVRKTTAKRMKRKLKELPHLIRMHRKCPKKALSTIASIEGWLKHANTHNFQISLQLQRLKEEIKDEQIQPVCKETGFTS